MTDSISGKIFIVDGKRTPFGKFGGSFSGIDAVDLSVLSSKALISGLSLDPNNIDQVIWGNVLPSTTNTLYGARHLALKIGAPVKTPAYNINRLCGSGIQIIWEAFNAIKLNQSKCVLVSGSENMTMAPHLVYGSRFGTKYGSLKTVDLLMDSLTDQYCSTPMGITAENLAGEYQITRKEADEFAAESHLKAAKAYEEGLLQGEIVPVEIKKGIVEKDEHLRAETSMEEMEKLRSTFKKDGTVTAANASGIVDGSASMIIASEKFCQENNLSPIAELIDFNVLGVEPTKMGIGPAPVIKELLNRNSMSLDQIDLVEINEAFAPQALACLKELSLDKNKVNTWGGAIALGHPLGASGTRITTTLARQLKSKNLSYGIASACIGGGQGIGVLIKSV